MTVQQQVEERFSTLISTKLDHYAQKIAKQMLRKALKDITPTLDAQEQALEALRLEVGRLETLLETEDV